jgi:general stress protein YciG
LHDVFSKSPAFDRGTSVALLRLDGPNEYKGGNVAKEDRGFASMERAKQREIASKGGKAAHQKGTAHEWTSEEARDAGRKGGLASHRRRREQKGNGTPGESSDESREMAGAMPGGSIGSMHGGRANDE